MRVIAGLYKGRTIRTVRNLSVRPATDRVRQTVFDLLSTRLDIEGISVLDLFAGSGSLGLEALSRGAASATFVESSMEAVRELENTVRSFHCVERARVIRADANRWFENCGGRFDLVFADPPYAFRETATLPARVSASGIVRPGGFLMIEHSTDLEFPSDGLWTTGPVRRFGRTMVTFFQPMA